MNIKIINKNIPILYNKNSIGDGIKNKDFIQHPYFLDTVHNKLKNNILCPVDNIEEGFIKCDYETKYNLDVFAYMSINDYDFLYMTYSIQNYIEAEKYINDELSNLHIYTKKRFCNAVYKAYREDINFPNSKFVEATQDILKQLYNKNISTKKILKIINKNKSCSKNKLPYEFYEIFK